MKICYLDAFSGISGDMTVGALLDAGADWNQLRQTLESLQLPATFRFERTKRCGIAAAKFSVDAADEKSHRRLPQIQAIIARASLGETGRKHALAVFDRLAEAEARAHNVPAGKVHFHEVGAVDSICDIVGACAALELLDVGKVYSSRINVGSGTVKTAHGVLPVPAPATAELLRECPVYAAGPEMELTTPTGAALAKTLAVEFGKLPAMRILAQGFGAGDRDFPQQANVLRVLIGETTGAAEATVVNVIEANIDDATPQVLGYATERLLEAGALDVTLTPIFMKKNRAATTISVIAAPDQTDSLAAILFAETTTLGVRILDAQRRVLAREVTTVTTKYGPIRVKYSGSANSVAQGSFAPEYDDCRKAALENHVPLRVVMAEANDVFRRR